MSIVGRNPESGVRVMIERLRDEGPPWAYGGAAFTPTTSHGLRVVVAGDGLVAVEVQGDDAPADLAQRVRQMVRAAYKHAQDAGTPPPRQIHRWKGGSGAW